MALKDLVIDHPTAVAMRIAESVAHLLYGWQYDQLVKDIADAIREAEQKK